MHTSNRVTPALPQQISLISLDGGELWRKGITHTVTPLTDQFQVKITIVQLKAGVEGVTLRISGQSVRV